MQMKGLDFMIKTNPKMTVVLVEPNKEARVTKIDNTLKAMQETVGGYIEAVYPYDDNVAIVCNEESKIVGLPLNRALKDADGKVYDIIAGTFLVAGLTEDNFGSLTEEQKNHYLKEFEHPEKFIRFGNEIIISSEYTPVVKGKGVKL